MKSWPLERIPHLGLCAFTAIVQSMTRAVIQRRTSLCFSDTHATQEFGRSRWEALGLDREAVENVTQQVNTMFHTEVPVPRIDATCGELAKAALAQWECGERLVTFFTSGTTGVPKPCTHRESHLRQEITSVAPLVEDRTAALVSAPLHHMYGFTFGLLLPLSLGIPFRTVPLLPTAVAAQMRPGDMVISIPLIWSRFVTLQHWVCGAEQRGTDITVFTATSPTPSEVLQTLLHYGFCVIEIFGSSEVGAFCYRKHPDAPFELLPHVRRGRGNGRGTLERLLPDDGLRQYPLMDTVTWLDDRHLRPGARIDKAVQVGGINVYPQHVAKVLERCDGVHSCAVRLMRVEEGFRLKAFVVPEANADPEELRASLIRFARSQLRDEERPGKYDFGADIPRSSVGKPRDW